MHPRDRGPKPGPHARPLRATALAAVLAVATAGFASAPASHEVSFRSGDITLVGTLSRPAGEGPFPAVVTVAGSGPQNRDAEIAGVPGYRPFAQLAAVLNEQGVAVLRFDERGVGASAGDNAVATSADLAADVTAAVAFLRARDDVDARRIGLLGHSEGGMIAAMVAARDPVVGFVIALAPPVADALEGLVRQERRMLEAAGAPAEVVEEQVAMTRRSLELTRAEDWTALEALLRGTVERQLAAMPEAQRAELGDAAELAERLVDQTMVQFRGWMHFFLSHDAQADWRQVAVPALVVFGGRDVQVDVALHRAALEHAVGGADAGGPVAIEVLPEANHLFQRATTGGVAEYAQLDPALSDELLELVAAWVRDTVGGP